MNRFKNLLFIFCLVLISEHFVCAEETTIIVRAKAKDAKFIGSSIGGAHVIIKNEQTNEVLAKGKTSGSTGNTSLIMKTPWERGKRISDDNTAKFQASIDINEPTFVTIDVFAPNNKKQARVNASTQIWLIPGKHILGDGVILEIPGFVVDVLKPQTHQFISTENLSNDELEIKANVVMMCGCTISNGGLWNANEMEVEAMITINGKAVENIQLKVDKQVNTFEGKLKIKEGGTYEIVVYAYNSKTGNTGVDKVNFIIGE